MKIEETFYGKLYSKGYIPFYAGAVSDGRWGILLPGESRSGKTTTVWSMVERGYFAMGDEFIALTEKDGKLFIVPGEELFPGEAFNRILPQIREVELLATVVLSRRGSGVIRYYDPSKDGLLFIYDTNTMKLPWWKKLTEVVSLFLRSPIYVTERPTLDKLLDFIESIFRDAKYKGE